ncbi:hypothetical protein [secondary endosymbiont of Ctenarytaina eucalypti]|nr:hypothetical protein [secondary endosymbiont of Ctenarytaina eucalypti]
MGTTCPKPMAIDRRFSADKAGQSLVMSFVVDCCLSAFYSGDKKLLNAM